MDLEKILKEHELWIESGGDEGERADLRGTDLRSAGLMGVDLSWAYLMSANLEGVDMRGADLSFVDLYGANLYKSDLSGACLDGANLKGAYLMSANLEGANLNGVTGNSKEIKTIQTPLWAVVIWKDYVQIACKRYKADEWFGFSDEEIGEMERRALDWWRTWKPVIKAFVEADKR